MNITEAISQGAANPVLLFAMALVLGALHGLEPGHSKTMMAAYIVAIKGSVFQAVLLGISAAASHSIVVWALALLGLHYGNELIGEDLEPVLMMVSGVIIIIIALWVFWQAKRSIAAHKKAAQAKHGHHSHEHSDAHVHDHSHDHGSAHSHEHHSHYDHSGLDGDAHARAHAREIEKRLSQQKTSTFQTILFGLTGGLIPCPSAITVLLLCLHLKKVTLGITLVSAFSIGLAVTLVSVGVIAAIGLRYATRKAPWLDKLTANAPFVSAAFIGFVGLIMIYAGVSHYG